MKTFILFLFLLVQFESVCETPLGIGMVRIHFDEKTVIDFYETRTDKSHIKRIEFFNDTAINSVNIRNLEKERQWLKPETIWLDYFKFNFRCKSKSPGWFEVIVNNEDGSSLWIRDSKSTKFETWKEYLKMMFTVERIEDEPQKIRESPTEESKEVKYQGKRDCFKVNDLNGDWIEVSTTVYCDQKNSEGKLGWIRWRRGNKLLIQYHSTS